MVSERKGMNPFKYKAAETRKLIVSLFFTIGAVVGLLVASDPGFPEACAALAGSVFAVFGVFAAKNHTPDDLQKALEQFKGAALTIVGYFTVVPTTTAERATAIIGAIVSVYAVYRMSNENPPAEGAVGAGVPAGT
jgi:hypothetical protein